MEKILKIKIRTGISNNYSAPFRTKLSKVEGCWLEVDTKYLFSSQFNTKPIPKVSEVGLRIYETDVEAIEGDERIGRSVCGYCGLWNDTGASCKGCSKGISEMIEFFPGTTRNAGMKSEVSNIFNSIIGAN